MRKTAKCLLAALPFILFAGEAQAWGLFTHVFFAQELIQLAPLLPITFQRAVLAWPELVLTGCCLPDLALIGKYTGTRAFDDTHRWRLARNLLDSAANDAERALATGYAGHLFVDIIAHHYFVPAHESLWFELPVVTHVVSEWAMDAYVEAQVKKSPARNLRHASNWVTAHLIRHFDCDRRTMARALITLARADASLRASRIPMLLLGCARVFDRALQARFDYYIEETVSRLKQFRLVLEGLDPDWDADARCPETARQRMRRFTLDELRHRLPLPVSLFAERHSPVAD